MPSVYLANVTGDGLRSTLFRPDVSSTTPYACLMLDEVKGKCIIVSTNDALSGTGILSLATGATWETLRADTKRTSPDNPQRNNVNNWLTTNGYQPVTAGMTWAEIIHFVARQVNPVADLDLTAVY